MKNFKWLFFFAFAWITTANAGQTGLFYKVQSDTGVGNREVFYTDVQKGFFILPGLGNNNEKPSSIEFQMAPTPDFSALYQSWTNITFTAPGGAPLAVGSYQDTISDYLTNQTGLRIDGGELPSCSGSGSFDVREVIYDSAMGSVASFAADFMYRCESTAQTTYGSVRYNSDVPFPDGMPITIGSDASLNSMSCFEATSMAGGTVTLHAVNGSDEYNYNWSAKVEGKSSSSSCTSYLTLSCFPGLSSSTTTLRNLTGEGETFAFDLALYDTEQAKVVLTATDTLTGEVQEAKITTCVSDSTPPKVTINSPKEGQQIVGNNFIIDATVEDAVDPNPVYYAMLGIYVIEFEAGKPVRVEVPETFRGKGEPIPLVFKVKAMDSTHNWTTVERNVTVQHDLRN